VEVRKFIEVKIPTMDKETTTYVIKFEKPSDNLPILNMKSIKIKTLNKPMTVKGPSIATNYYSISKGSSNINPILFQITKFITHRKSMHILKHQNSNSTHFQMNNENHNGRSPNKIMHHTLLQNVELRCINTFTHNYISQESHVTILYMIQSIHR